MLIGVPLSSLGIENSFVNSKLPFRRNEISHSFRIGIPLLIRVRDYDEMELFKLKRLTNGEEFFVTGLPRPADSVLWSDELLGNGNGYVKTGPFKVRETQWVDLMQ